MRRSLQINTAAGQAPEELELIECLGEGAFGRVYRGEAGSMGAWGAMQASLTAACMRTVWLHACALILCPRLCAALCPRPVALCGSGGRSQLHA